MKHFLFITLFLTLFSCNSNDSVSDNELSETDSIISSIEVENVPTEQPKSNSIRDYQEFYPDGSVKIEGNYDADKKRNGLWLSYYENGNKWSETFYTSGKKNGHSITFFPNGKVRYVGEYLADEKAGEWTFYDESGNTVDTVTY